MSVSHLHEFVCLESRGGLNEQLSVLRLILEGGIVDVTEWHVILKETKGYFQRQLHTTFIQNGCYHTR